ncbi:MAG: Ig-like domain repeat protein, partial [Methanosphaera sp.]|nr:Ig-like domain repeat protein [Methanosphaera sp.]
TEDFDGFVGDEVVITAIVESDGVEVTEGMIRFTNLEGEVLTECDLSNGPASYNFGIISEEFDDEITVEFINSDNYYADSEIITISIIKKYADIELTTTEATIGSPITVTARVTYEDELVSQGQVVFTDDDGNVIDTVDIVDGIATTDNVQFDQAGIYTIYAEVVDPVYVAEDSIEITLEKIPVTISITEDQTVAVGDSVTITATITSQNGVVNGGKVIFTKGNTKIGESEVIEGTASIDYVPTGEGSVEISAKYVPADIYSIDEDTAICTVTANKVSTTTTVDEVTLTAGKTVTLTARITADDDSIVNTGKVTFKINGKTLKDENGKVIYIKVVDGVATYDYEVPSDLVGKDVTIEAVYSGSAKYVNSKDKTDSLTVLTGEATLEIISESTVTKGETATFTVKVTDNGVDINEGKVVFKINGKTLKDSDGKVLYANVVDGVASIDYVIPESMKSKDYTLAAVFTSSTYERCEVEETITVQ